MIPRAKRKSLVNCRCYRTCIFVLGRQNTAVSCRSSRCLGKAVSIPRISTFWWYLIVIVLSFLDWIDGRRDIWRLAVLQRECARLDVVHVSPTLKGIFVCKWCTIAAKQRCFSDPPTHIVLKISKIHLFYGLKWLSEVVKPNHRSSSWEKIETQTGPNHFIKPWLAVRLGSY